MTYISVYKKCCGCGKVRDWNTLPCCYDANGTSPDQPVILASDIAKALQGRITVTADEYRDREDGSTTICGYEVSIDDGDNP